MLPCTEYRSVTCAALSSEASTRSSSGICASAFWNTDRAAVLSSSKFEALQQAGLPQSAAIVSVSCRAGSRDCPA